MKIKPIGKLILFILVLGAAVGGWRLWSGRSIQKPPPKSSDIAFRMHGSNTIGSKLGPELVKTFLEQKKGATSVMITDTAPDEKMVRGTLPSGEIAVEIHAHGSSTAFKDLAEGKCDLGMASRKIKQEELDLLRAKGLGDLTDRNSEYVLGLDGLAIIVNSKNPIGALTRDQIKKVFTGEITDWSKVGGSGASVTTFARDDKSGTYDTFKALVLGEHSSLKAGTQRLEDSAELVKKVSEDPNAIGFVGFSYVESTLAVKAVAVNDPGTRGLLPSIMTVATEDYLLHRRLYLYAPQTSRKPLAEEFIRFALSEEGQKVVSNVGFVGQDITANMAKIKQEQHQPGINIPSDASPAYRQLFAEAERQPTTIKFKAGSFDIDNKAGRDLDQIVRIISRDPAKSTKIVLVGFTDNIGNPKHNEELSFQRARTVADDLGKRGIIPGVRGEGQRCPRAGNDTPAGKEENRRVEVWVRK